ncbi:PfkB family carbohydrate kinase [Streptomyces sp. NPDC048496]|uniref:PfkB family carbohydrate kinase n=1 Tax=Streptomyces sp. NPDC048496 TaxID=3365558 RepID=UPI00371826A5
MTGIAVLGSTHMDLVAYVARAPQRGETVTGREFRTVPGGKGANQAVAAARAGGDLMMIGTVGDDAYGAQLRSGLEHAGVDTTVDTTGAGDTFVGMLAVALGEGRSAPEALAWASSAAALRVQKPGASTSMPYRSEIDAA